MYINVLLTYLFTYLLNRVSGHCQWRRQRSEGARSFRGQTSSSQVTRMHFFLKKVDDLF